MTLIKKSYFSPALNIVVVLVKRQSSAHLLYATDTETETEPEPHFLARLFLKNSKCN